MELHVHTSKPNNDSSDICNTHTSPKEKVDSKVLNVRTNRVSIDNQETYKMVGLN